MKFSLTRGLLCACITLAALLQNVLPAQCLSYPVTLEAREANSQYIVLGKLKDQRPYWDAEHKCIYTLNIIEVTAWLKGHNAATQIGVITMGGIVGDKAQITYPSLKLAPYNEYVLFLQGNNTVIDNRELRASRPDLVQVEPYADAQGAITKQMGVFHDLYSEPNHTEASLFRRIQDLTGLAPRDPKGKEFYARPGDTFPLGDWSVGNHDASKVTAPITSFSPSPTNAGTIVTSDFITINGSAFGAAAGTVFYTNADDGGATFTASGVATDNVSWSATSIQNKPASEAGTGPININGAMTSATNLTINYAQIDINSTFNGFGSSTRQAFHLIAENGAGGYTFTYNTAFNANAPAAAAFRRAVSTWRCATFVNWRIASTTSALATVGNDGTNLVFFDGTLPAGVLGRANSFFSATSTAACNLANTVWYTNEVDVQFFPDPPTAGFPWEYGPAAPAFTEYDFESVAVHELGHAHGLGHTISAGTVMHFAISNGSQARTPNVNEIAGGNQKMSFSTAPLCTTPAGVNGPMVALTAGTCLLPLEHVFLTGEHVPGSGNLLRWEVTAEEEALGYTVERRMPNMEFAPIAYVPAAQNDPGGNLVYNFLDAQLTHADVHYYRLARMDVHGDLSYSDVLSVRNPMGVGLDIYPSVVSDRLHIQGLVGGAGNMRFRLYNVNGGTVMERDFSTSDGTVAVEVGMEGIAPGLYLYHVDAPGLKMAGKLIHE